MSDATPVLATRPPRVVLLASAAGALIGIVLVFAMIRVSTDWPHILARTVPEDDYSERYVAHPWLAYLHIAPGVAYLLGAPLQLTRHFRTRHYTVHRWLGRALLSFALVTGVLAMVFGLFFSWGGVLEASASLIFGAWFVACLVLAFRAIRRTDVSQHRRWMIRAFAVGVGVGTIRLWVGVFTALTIGRNGGPEGLTLPNQFTLGVAFWLAFTMHVAL
ncbi:MAG: DUF2306 domain-containing protein, partial [Pedococcus sp.]